MVLKKYIMRYYNEIENKIYSSLPNEHGNVLNGYKNKTERHREDGFFELVTPVIDDTQYLGQLIFDEVNDVYTYEVLDKPIEQIESEEKARKKAERDALLKQGVIVDGFWFNDLYLGQFIASIQTDEKAGALTTMWKNDADEWKELAIADAYALCKKAKDELQQFYIIYS